MELTIYLRANLFFLRINSIKTQPMKMHKNQTHSCNIITKPIRHRWPVYATDSTSGKGEGKGEDEGNTGIKNYFIRYCFLLVSSN